MKSFINSFALMAVAALTLLSCQKEIANESIADDGINVTIIAGNPVTRTVLGDDGTTPYWKDGDALSVTNGTSTNVEFKENNIAEGGTSTIATFSGKVSEAGDFYAVYPHTGTITNGAGPRVTVPTEQHPTASSYDGAADIMVSKKFNVGVTTSTTIDNLQFARCGAILKIVFSGKAADQQTLLANQHPVSVSLTAENDLVGNVLFDYENGTASISTIPSKTVSASYTTSTQYAIDGTNATYLVVVPTTLTGTLEVAATTEDYEISRTLPLPDDGIELEAGKVYTFNVKLGANSITDATPAQTLPWNHDFSWHESTEETNYTADILEKSQGEFTNGALVYGAKEAGAIRIGNGSNPGSITSKLLNLSGAFSVTVRAKAYNTSDNSQITVTVGDVTKTASSNLTSDYVNYEFDFAVGDGTAKSPIIIGTSKKRAVITSVSVSATAPKVVTPKFSPAAGEVEANTEVTITCDTEGATIYYTTDGSDPTTSSTNGTAVTIDSKKTIKAFAVKEGYRDSDIATAVYTIAGSAESLPYNNTLINGHDGFTFNVVSDGGLDQVWSDTKYGLQANGYNCTDAIEAYAVSPLIDLTSVTDAKLSFTHGINFFADVATAKNQATLQVRVKDGTWTNVVIPIYPTELGNTTADTEVNLQSFTGNIIQFRFKYVATTTNPGRWQIKNVKVEEVVSHDIDPIVIDSDTEGFPTSYGASNTFTQYTLDGIKYKIQQVYVNGEKLQWRASGNSNGTGTIYNTDAMPSGITSIVIVYNSGDSNKNHTVQIGTSENPTSATSITPTITGSTYTYAGDGASQYFVITNGANAGYIDSITINFD